MRLFTAVWPDQEVVEKLAGLTHDNRFRWLKPETLHITLCFYGSLSDEAANDLITELANVKSPSFTAELGPATHLLKRQLVYVPVRGVEPLAQELGVENLMGHLTLARSKHPVRNYEPVSVSAQWEVNSFTLTQSRTLPEGAVYETVKKYALAPAL